VWCEAAVGNKERASSMVMLCKGVNEMPVRAKTRQRELHVAGGGGREREGPGSIAARASRRRQGGKHAPQGKYQGESRETNVRQLWRSREWVCCLS
jgi:hypothetical protein